MYSRTGLGAALEGASFASAAQLRAATDAVIDRYNQHAVPFQWRKAHVPRKGLAARITDLC